MIERQEDLDPHCSPDLMAEELNECGFMAFFCASVCTTYVGAHAIMRVWKSENNTPEMALSTCIWSSRMELRMPGLHIAHPLSLGLAFYYLKMPPVNSM